MMATQLKSNGAFFTRKWAYFLPIERTRGLVNLGESHHSSGIGEKLRWRLDSCHDILSLGIIMILPKVVSGTNMDGNPY